MSNIDYNMLKERIYQHLAVYATKVDGRYNRPWSGDSDSGALSVTETADGRLLAKDHVEDRGYNDVTLARRLGVEIPRLASTRRGLVPQLVKRSISASAPDRTEPDRTEPASASSASAPDQTPDAPAPDAPAAAYVDLADYATRHGVPVEAFRAAGWRETRSRGHLAFAFPTKNGTRYRYADAVAAGSKYGNQRGYKSCWHGIPNAVAIAAARNMDTLLLVNGEPAVVCGQYRGLPAVALTNSGERSKLPPELLAELRQAWSGRVIVCGDNDAKGRKAAPALAASLRAAGIDAAHLIIPVDRKGADLADWLMTRPNRYAPADDLAALVDLAEQTRPAAREPDGIEPAAALAVARPSEVILASMSQLGYSFKFNQMAQTVEVNGARLDDQTRAALLVSAMDHGLIGRGISENMFWSIVRVGAGASTYHPLRQYFDGLVWDGVDHIGALLRHIQCDGAVVVYPDQTRVRLLAVYLTRWLIGAVAKVYSRAQNLMLVWNGPQGTGKSALVRWLCDAVGSDYHIEAPLDLDNKDTRFRLLEKFLWEVAELEGVTRKADVNALKHFVTMQTVTERRPYDRYDTTGQAVCSLFGTVNGGGGFLVDDTGNRRFMVSTVQRIDWRYRQLVDPAQLWSQAVALYRAGVSHQLTQLELAHQTTANMAHMAPSTLDDYIAAWFAFDDPDAFLTAGQIETHLRQRGYESFTGGGASVAVQIRQSMLRVAGRDLAVRTSRQRGYRGVRTVDAPRQPTGGRPDQTPDLTGVSDMLPDVTPHLSPSVTHLSQGLAHQKAKVTEVTDVTDVSETFKTSGVTDDGHAHNPSASGVSDGFQKVLQAPVTSVTSVTDGALPHQDAVARVVARVTDDDRCDRPVTHSTHTQDELAAAFAAMELADAHGIETKMSGASTGWLVCVDVGVGVWRLAETADDLRRLITDAIDQQRRRKAS